MSVNPRAKTTLAYIPVLPSGIPVPHRFNRSSNPLPPSLPFNRDPRHTIPTKWVLYRSLLRATRPKPTTTQSPTDHIFPPIHRHTREIWRKARAYTSPNMTLSFLTHQQTFLSLLLTSPTSPTLTTLSTHLSTLQSRTDAQTAFLHHLKHNPPKPHLKGGFIYPTANNPPLPRLHPQPPSISGMIRKRIASRDKRIENRRKYGEWLGDAKEEVAFLRRLGIEEEGGGGASWEKELRGWFDGMEECFRRDKRREAMVFDEKLVERVLEARKCRRRDAQEWARKRKLEKNRLLEESSN